MTPRKQLPEQIASYNFKEQNPSEMKEQSRVARNNRNASQAPRTLQRVVTIPEADPSVAWNSYDRRQEQLRRARAKPQKYVKVEARTYAQTGNWASSGRMKAVRRELPPLQSTSIPKRSSRRKRRGFFWKVLGMFAGALVVVLAANFAFTSNAFRIEQVNVVGTHNDALIHAIQKMGMQGQNIFFVNVPAVTERIEASSFVSSASLSKQLPNQLTVTVVERQPVLLWQTPSGVYGVDSQGVVIAPVNQMTGVDHLNVVITNTGHNGQVQQTGSGSQATPVIRTGMRLKQTDIAFVLQVFNRLPQLTGINAFKLRYDGTMYPDTTNGNGMQNSGGSYVIESPDGWIAYLGGADDGNSLDNRLIELQQILALVKKQQLNLASVDLRYGLHPVYTLR
jgi:cell division septal protein FtsQ